MLVIVPETSTELISNAIKPLKFFSVYDKINNAFILNHRGIFMGRTIRRVL